MKTTMELINEIEIDHALEHSLFEHYNGRVHLDLGFVAADRKDSVTKEHLIRLEERMRQEVCKYFNNLCYIFGEIDFEWNIVPCKNYSTNIHAYFTIAKQDLTPTPHEHQKEETEK